MAYLGGTIYCWLFPFIGRLNYDFVEQVDVFSIEYNTMAYLCV